MLSDRGIQYYFDNLQKKSVNFDSLRDAIQKRFLAEEPNGALLREWNSFTFQTVRLQKIGTKCTECLKLLSARLEDIQSRLTKIYQKKFF